MLTGIDNPMKGKGGEGGGRKEGKEVGSLSLYGSVFTLSLSQEPLGELEGGQALEGVLLLVPGPQYTKCSGSSPEPSLEGHKTTRA